MYVLFTLGGSEQNDHNGTPHALALGGCQFIYLEPINQNFHLYVLVIIIHIPNRHSAFFIKYCPVLLLSPYPAVPDFAIFKTSRSSVPREPCLQVSLHQMWITAAGSLLPNYT